jgi:signal transduction histidine kinase
VYALRSSRARSYRRARRYQKFTSSVDVASDVLTMTVVPARWAEMLRNLLDNALVQPSQVPEVCIHVKRAGEHVLTTVRDRGPGFLPKNHAHVFRRFYTDRPVGVEPGTRLGLSIVQAIAHAHDGKVTLESTVNEGAAFSVSLPA